jgi:hypothetical protein
MLRRSVDELETRKSLEMDFVPDCLSATTIAVADPVAQS